MKGEKERDSKKIMSMALTAILVISAFAASVPSASAVNENVTVTIDDCSAPTGGSVTTPIMINNVADVGTATINLIYDASVVHVDSISGSPFDYCDSTIDNTTGITTIGVMQLGSPGLTGDVKVCDVKLTAVGSPSETSALGLVVTEMKDATPPLEEIPRTVINGTFTGVAPEVVINEFVSNNATAEWVELFNNGSTDISLTGWTLEDAAHHSKSLSGLGTIAVGDYKVFTCSSGWLNNPGDVIWLNSTTENVDRVGYGNLGGAPAPGAGKSAGRYPNGIDTDDDAADFIVFDTPTPGEENAIEQPDLIVTAITPNCNYMFANESNNVSATIRNNGTADAGAFNVSFVIDGFNATASVSELDAGNETEVSITDPTLRYAGVAVNITVTADCDGAIVELNETNNATVQAKTIVNQGYKGKTYTGGENITTWKTFDLKGNLSYSLGDSYYASGSGGWTHFNVIWTASDLPVSGTATIEEARLYVPYCWAKDRAMPNNYSMTFNGNPETFDVHYWDTTWYSKIYPYFGMLVYNVTANFSTSGNIANFTSLWSGLPSHSGASMRGMLLVVIYADDSEPQRKIFVNEEFDMLYGGSSKCTTPVEATAYAPFTGTIEDTKNVTARLITIAPGAGYPYYPDEGELIFNGHIWYNVWNETNAFGAQIGIDDRNVTEYLNTTNEAGFQSSGDWMEASNAILVVEYVEIPPSVSISTDKTTYHPSDTMIVTLNLTNPMDTAQDVWFAWYFGIPAWSYWGSVIPPTLISLPAGCNYSLPIPIPVVDWGATGFGAVWLVELYDPVTFETISSDTAEWSYFYAPPAVSIGVRESELTAVNIAEEMSEEINKTFKIEVEEVVAGLPA